MFSLKKKKNKVGNPHLFHHYRLHIICVIKETIRAQLLSCETGPTLSRIKESSQEQRLRNNSYSEVILMPISLL